jgi:hypothetical protein
VRRLPRILLRILTTLSLLLCTATLLLWLQSHHAPRAAAIDRWWPEGQTAHHRRHLAAWAGGLLMLRTEQRRIDLLQGQGIEAAHWITLNYELGHRAHLLPRQPLTPADLTPNLRYGFGLGRAKSRSRDQQLDFKSITMPFWFPATTLALLPAAEFLRMLHTRRRRAQGLCPTCGYDLRATPDRCPECGKIPMTGQCART